MKRLISVATLGLLWLLGASWAQVYAPNDKGVTFGQWYTIVRDVDATKRFWAILGATPIKIDEIDVMKFPGILIFLKQGTPSGGTEGSPISHVGFGALEVEALLAEMGKPRVWGKSIGGASVR